MENKKENETENKKDTKMDNICKTLKNIRWLDIFGINYQFRVNNQKKHRTLFGSVLTIIVVSLILGFFLERFFDFLSKGDLQIQFIDKHNEKIEFTPQKFHLSFKFVYKNKQGEYQNVLGSEIEDIFDIKLTYNIYHRNLTKEIFHKPRINCNQINMTHNFPKNESKDFLNEHVCYDYGSNEIYGIWGDEAFSYYEFNIALNDKYRKTEKKQ